MNYYETQLKEALRDFNRYPNMRVKFQGVDVESSTNWLTLNAESAAAIIAALREQFGVVSEPQHAQKEPRYLHFMTGSVDTREGWISSYPAEEL